MRHIDMPPNWAARLTERSRQRRTGNRITRWIALPARKSRIASALSGGTAGATEHSSNDNLFAFPPHRATA